MSSAAGSPSIEWRGLRHAYATRHGRIERIRDKLDTMLQREGRFTLAVECFAFLPTRVRLDLHGWGETDIFAHG